MSATPGVPAPQSPLPPPAGRLVFDGGSELDSAVADRLHDDLFPSEPAEPRRPLYRQEVEEEPAGKEGDGGGSADSGGEEAGTVPAEPWPEPEPEPEPEPLSAAALRVLERRRLTRERFSRRQGAVRELQRRSGQRPAGSAPLWSPPVLVYRPPPLRTLQRRLLEPGRLADTEPETPGRSWWQIDEFCRSHLPEEAEEDAPR